MHTKVWDLHCDTLSIMRRDPSLSFAHMPLHVDLAKLKQGNYLLQCMACFVNLGREEVPLTACLEMIDIFYRILETWPDDVMQVTCPADIDALAASGKIGLMLTGEEGGICMDDPAVLRILYRLGMRMMTLTWNYRNGLGYPNNPHEADEKGDAPWPQQPETKGGLTAQGFAFVEEMERLHMIVDVSHLSDRGFWDVVSAGKRPFAASHSNARALCPHVRNLTDEMIRVMGERGCLIGLNFCPAFLDDRPDRSPEKLEAKIADMVRHVRHLTDLGGEDIVALGSDFDGIGGYVEVADASHMPLLAEGLLQAGFSPRQVDKIFHGNAVRFFRDNL